MARKAKFVDKDLGWNRVKREIAKARRRPHVAVGIMGTKAQKDHGGTPNIQVATAHEFGLTINHPGGTAYVMTAGGPKFVSNAAARGRNLPRTRPHKIPIPQRSFIRGTIDARARKIQRMAKALVTQVFTGRMSTKRALELLGIFVQGQIRERMSKGIRPPLKASTIRRKTIQGKKGTTPLIETGQLRASIDYQVRNA